MPDEIELFKIAGFGENLLLSFGLFQVASAISILFSRIRKPGAAILAVTFGISTILIFLSGQVAFGIFSIVPILLLGVIMNDRSKILV
jgi:hypothetical protein